VLWEFNRFLPEKSCQTGTLAKTILLIFTIWKFWQPSAPSYLPLHPFFKSTVLTLGPRDAAASAA